VPLSGNRRNLSPAPADTARMPIALPPPSTAWSVRTLDLGRTLVERRIDGVVVRVEVYDGGRLRKVERDPEDQYKRGNEPRDL
jgi:hypothetical protein